MKLKRTAIITLGLLATSFDAQAASDSFHAAEIHRVTQVDTAAIRNRDSKDLRITIWYPASHSAAEQPIVIGDPANPIFNAGAAAPDGAWADNSRRPLVLMSHGFGGVARQLAWLGTAMARAGFIVVSVDHPGTNGIDGVTPEGANLFWERATDMRAALDYVLADPALSAHVDVKRIGAGGFSLGGYTAALLAGATSDLAALGRFCASPSRDAICNRQVEYTGKLSADDPVLSEPRMQPFLAREKRAHREPRVRAAFLIAPAIVQGLDLPSLSKIHVPVTALAGSADPVVPAQTNANVLAARIPGASLITLPRVGHYDFLAECSANGLRFATTYCTDGHDTRRAETHATTTDAVVRFFEANLR